ncbi:unnamed protein product [Citrullus colocynthis]|uniref:Uncharacterized protein n=1 Tax=Citrullus colocynthis TaxID=252529 RepID=A0ABP0YXT0_9ROSI
MAEEIEERRKMVIAMKGHPGTGKSTLAQSLASLLKIPLIDKDDVKDCAAPVATATTAALVNDLSYDVVFRLASTQLRLGLSVVVDTPLSRRSLLCRLADMASTAGARLLIVECRPSDLTEWRRRLESRGAGDQTNWHKPSTWREIEMLLESYGGCTEFDVGDVPRLVVDTTAPVSVDETVSTVIDFIVSNGGSFNAPWAAER